MEIYDIIHGTIIIDSFAQKIINTEEFQRLRNIKQLGCCNYIFPSAIHTRFEHSIGVYHLSKRYIQILNTKDQFTDNDIKCITIGALIHDIGHGPYSHLFDEIVSDSKNHEYRSIELLKYMNKKYDLNLSEEDINKINTIIYPKNKEHIIQEKKYIYQIVSNQNGIDVDRFDYIMRDIKMTGLNYGIEYERIMNHSFIQNNEIVFSEKVQTSIEEFFRIRFIMYKEVYNHHTVRGIEYMMKDYLKLLDSYINFSDIINKDKWNQFMILNDSIIDKIPFIEKMNGETSWLHASMKEIIKNIKTRNIYKSVGEIITDSKIKQNEYNNDHLIIDTIKISFYGIEKCKFVQLRKSINTSQTSQNNDKFITTIYYKSNEYKKEAEDLFNIIGKGN